MRIERLLCRTGVCDRLSRALSTEGCDLSAGLLEAHACLAYGLHNEVVEGRASDGNMHLLCVGVVPASRSL